MYMLLGNTHMEIACAPLQLGMEASEIIMMNMMMIAIRNKQ